jgi:radical SAM superfamily enzyme YgiQ (UPF0313 family)
MHALMIYPSCPETFWSFKHALKFISKKAVHPPLGLMTVAAMLPDAWETRLVDMNVSKLRKREIAWADIVFISAMIIQKESVRDVLRRCTQQGVRVVCGGPLFTAGIEAFEGVDHLVLDEAEETLPEFLRDLERGNPRSVYRAAGFPRLSGSPVPRWDLIKKRKYVSMTLQYSRGCPFNCDFCDITVLFGRKVRTKGTAQLLGELESLYQSGWRGGVFFSDDNFIGNRVKLKREVLPVIVDWMEYRKHPFSFSTEVSINLADDEETMALMVRAGFDTVFIGIETPDEQGLLECGKAQNVDRDIAASVKRVQDAGLRVRGGFIVGFDSDTTSTFKRLVEFIQRCDIITAMVGLLNAPRGTRLYARLARQNRLLTEFSGDNTSMSTNVVPKMGSEALQAGYMKIIHSLYSAKPYYERVRQFLAQYTPQVGQQARLHLGHIRYHAGYLLAAVKSVVRLGIIDRDRLHFWKLLTWSLVRRPRLVPMAITYAIYGFHFRKVYGGILEEHSAQGSGV